VGVGREDGLPRLSDGVELLGEYEGSGFKEPPYIARRADGQVVQLPRLLYLVAEEADGRSRYDEIAARVTERHGRDVSAENVSYLVDEKLRPLGILAAADGSSPKLKRADPMLALTFRVGVLPDGVVRLIGTSLAPLFWPPIVVAVIGGLVAVDVWLFFVHGLARGARELIYQPAAIVLLYGLLVVSIVFHEFGHAAAARYGGAKPGIIGAGLYLIWPVFYTDVTDAYRLSRAGRLRTDLGGVYFNAIFILGTVGAYVATGFEPLLVIILVQHFQMLYQFLPFVRLDGYYIVGDLVGVPDMFSRIKPTLKSLLPSRESDPRVSELKPWVRAAVTAYVLTLIPAIALAFGFLLVNAPRIFATAWDSLSLHAGEVSASFGAGHALTALAGVGQLASLGLPAVGFALTFARVVKRFGAGAWRWSAGDPARRALVAAGTVGCAALVLFIWWPNGDYKPIQPQERGTIQGAIEQLGGLASGRPALTPEREQELGGVTRVADEPAVSDDEEAPANEDQEAPATGEEEGPSATTETPTTETTTDTATTETTTTDTTTTTETTTMP
jgi:putative peptide zinc metalloprotease protein